MGRGGWAKKGICAAGKRYFFSVLPKKQSKIYRRKERERGEGDLPLS